MNLYWSDSLEIFSTYTTFESYNVSPRISSTVSKRNVLTAPSPLPRPRSVRPRNVKVTGFMDEDNDFDDSLIDKDFNPPTGQTEDPEEFEN
jgi:hypothetical protein